MSKYDGFFSALFHGGKGITDAGADAARAIKGSSMSINGNTLSHNLAKYTLLPIGAGIGGGVGIAGFTNIASAGVRKSLGLDFGNDDGTAKTPTETIVQYVEKVSGWGIVLLLILAGVLIYNLYKNGGKKK